MTREEAKALLDQHDTGCTGFVREDKGTVMNCTCRPGIKALRAELEAVKRELEEERATCAGALFDVHKEQQRAERAEAELAYSQERRAETAKLHTEALNGWARDKALYAEARGHVAELVDGIDTNLNTEDGIFAWMILDIRAWLKKTETK